MAEGAEQPWTRHSPWRQGHVLTPEVVTRLGLADEGSGDNIRAVVISHDCDLANENLNAEPDVEVLLGTVVAGLNGNYAGGKSPRTLHLQVNGPGGPEVFELVQTAKRSVPKTELAKYQPSAGYSVDQRMYEPCIVCKRVYCNCVASRDAAT